MHITHRGTEQIYRMNDSKKIVVITGATGGLGREVCKFLLKNNYTILAACRNLEKGEAVRMEIEKSIPSESRERLLFFEADMYSFHSVDHFTTQVIEYITRIGAKIELLINNAGIIAPRFELTPDGYESSLQVNYLSARRLTETLIPHLSLSGSKIINTLSCTVKVGRAVVENKEIEEQKKEFVSLKNYSNSKLMLARYTLELHKRLSGTIICAVDPGIVNTGIITMHRWYDPLANIFFRPFIKSPTKGAIPMINAINHTTATPLPLLFKGNYSQPSRSF